MRNVVLGVVGVVSAFALGRLSAQDIQPSCKMCPGTYVAAEEIQEYQSKKIVDQQIRSLDVGKTNLQIATSYRPKLDKPAAVAEHDLVTEVYYVIGGGGTHVTGPDLVNPERRVPSNNAVATLNGPGHNATDVRNGATQQLKPGDVLVIPAGTGHQFTKIDDHISYVMIRVDPDRVVPLMNEAQSKAYLAGKK